jgi:hypothetical protein
LRVAQIFHPQVPVPGPVPFPGLLRFFDHSSWDNNPNPKILEILNLLINAYLLVLLRKLSDHFEFLRKSKLQKRATLSVRRTRARPFQVLFVLTMVVQ